MSKNHQRRFHCLENVQTIGEKDEYRRLGMLLNISCAALRVMVHDLAFVTNEYVVNETLVELDELHEKIAVMINRAETGKGANDGA